MVQEARKSDFFSPSLFSAQYYQPIGSRVSWANKKKSFYFYHLHASAVGTLLKAIQKCGEYALRNRIRKKGRDVFKCKTNFFWSGDLRALKYC